MSRMAKDNARASLKNSVNESVTGELFVRFDGSIFDSSQCHVVHSGLDTVRQLYSGDIRNHVLNDIVTLYASVDATWRILNFDFQIQPGGKSGYKWILKNPNLGVTILFQSTFIQDINTTGSHLKIQLSPIFLLTHSAHEIQAWLDDLAHEFLCFPEPCGVAFHLCADVQGWQLPFDLDSTITMRARRVQRCSGIKSVVGMDYELNDVAVVYGRGQSFTFGQASTLQFAAYDKIKAVKDKGELPLWLPVWSQHDSFKEDEQIVRFEARFHHSVVKQFAAGSGIKADSFIEIFPHLAGFWQYALNNFRLDDSSSYINPFWQWLRDDTQFYDCVSLDIDYKRFYKSPNEENEPSEKAVKLAFGMLCGIFRKKNISVDEAYYRLQQSGMWEYMCNIYYQSSVCQSKQDVHELMYTLLCSKMAPRH